MDISEWNQRNIPETEYIQDLKLLSKANSLLHFLVGIGPEYDMEKKNDYCEKSSVP